jgi:hypothetical protein
MRKFEISNRDQGPFLASVSREVKLMRGERNTHATICRDLSRNHWHHSGQKESLIRQIDESLNIRGRQEVRSDLVFDTSTE